MTSPLPSPCAGDRIGIWTLDHLLGSGGQGTTWAATDHEGRRGALKVLSTPPGEELRTLARLAHPAIVGLLDVGNTPRPYLVMERADGYPLRTWMDAHALSERELMSLGVSLFDAAGALHQAGVTHADIKPENLIVARPAAGPLSVRLIDFGLAMSAAGGTPAYLAPEVLQGAAPSPAADVYMIAVVLWEALHGALPWAVSDLDARLGAAPWPGRGPAWLQETLHEALHPEPSQRPGAAILADRFAAHGFSLPQLSAEDIAQRLDRLYLPDPRCEAILSDWLVHGGALAISGPAGVGRSRLLRRLLTERLAQGADCQQVTTQETLAPIQSGPVVLLVDDFEEKTPQLQAALAARAEQGWPIAVVAQSPPSWAERHLRVEPMGEAQVYALAAQLLGTGQPPEQMLDALSAYAEGQPGRVGRFLSEAITVGALFRGTLSWLWDPLRAHLLRGLAAEGAPTLPDAVRPLALAAAVYGEPTPLDELADLLEIDRDALRAPMRALIDARLLAADAMQQLVWCTDEAMAANLSSSEAARPLHAAVLRRRLLERSPPLWRMGQHALACGIPELLGGYAPAAIIALADRNPADAAALSDALWTDEHEPDMLQARLIVLRAVGRIDEARALGRMILAEPTQEAASALVEVARIQLEQDNLVEDALRTLMIARTAAGRREPEMLLLEAQAMFRIERYDEAQALAAQVGGGVPPRDRKLLHRWLQARTVWAQALHGAGDLKEAIALLTAVPDGLGGGTAVQSTLLGALSRLQWFHGDYAAAAETLQRASENPQLSLADRARMSNNLGAVRYHSGDRAGALAAWESALAMFQLLDLSIEVIRAQNNLCLGYMEAGRWSRSRHAGEAALRAAEAAEDVELQCLIIDNLARLALVRQRLEEAAALIQRGEDLLRDTPSLVRQTAELAMRRAELAAHRQDSDALQAARCACAAAQLAKMDDATAIAETLSTLATAKQDPQAAAAALTRLNTRIAEMADPAEKTQAQIWLAEVAIELGQLRDAQTLLTQASQFGEQNGLIPLTQHAAAAVERMDARHTSPDDDASLDHIISLATRIGQPDDLPSLLQEIARVAVELLGGERAFVLMGTPPEVVSEWQNTDHRPLSMSVVEQAIREQAEVLAMDLGEHSELQSRESIIHLDLRSVLCAPMMRDGAPIGAIYVDSKTASRQQMLRASRLMRVLAALAGVTVVKACYHQEALSQARRAARLLEQKRYQQERLRLARQIEEKNRQLEALNARLQRQATVDELTGLRNRRSFIDALNAHHGAGPYGLIMVDVDRFKRFNDTWGHQAGDQVLQQVAQALQDGAHPSVVYRYGGEEMIVIADVDSADQLDILGETLRLAIARTPLVLETGEPVRITASLGGIWSEDAPDSDGDALLKMADAALYAAKESGRNRYLRHPLGSAAADESAA
ncbi:MAG: diguanylate cyclase [Myxococcota bacterium]